ncbi:hypothetical protein C4D60_Mb10t01580 [Musa balbisiana]|uniref:Uncharacterized protein n=1 Tax=Musa balbisiana TaxID=52838 RepID=A0A4S8IUR3_MUSBA|nr:hypothetical protein C4D60_Mb10t01580 [Musa balbisiana]
MAAMIHAAETRRFHRPHRACRWRRPRPRKRPAQPDGFLQGLQRALPGVQAGHATAVTITAYLDDTLEFTVKSPSVSCFPN